MHNSLRKILSCPLRTQIYNKINPVLFDVSLRDGIQGASPEMYPTYLKRNIFNRIQTELKPQSIEIGSIVSPKVLPIMQDSLEMHDYAIRNRIDPNTDIYMLIPSFKALENAMSQNVLNYSFISSVSEEFQFKNTKKSIQNTLEELVCIKSIIDPYKSKSKLYLSCINHCPIIGKIDNEFVIDIILEHSLLNMFDQICLSDTCGKLTYDDFLYIISKLHYYGITQQHISFHFHMSSDNYHDIRKIMNYCFDNSYNKFDVSFLETGGCSVTMGKNVLPNMSYDDFYGLLEKYIEKELS
jgi:hydroxymethylglutaryl-CoA lyase